MMRTRPADSQFAVGEIQLNLRQDAFRVAAWTRGLAKRHGIIVLIPAPYLYPAVVFALYAKRCSLGLANGLFFRLHDAFAPVKFDVQIFATGGWPLVVSGGHFDGMFVAVTMGDHARRRSHQDCRPNRDADR